MTDPQTDEPARYRRRSDIRAVQWTGSNEAELSAFCSPFDFWLIDPEDRIEDPDQTAAVRTHAHGGWVGVRPGDWVLREEGQYSTASDEEFRREWVPAAPPTGQTALRQEIRRVLAAVDGFNLAWLDPQDYGPQADAVLAVLSPPTEEQAATDHTPPRISAREAEIRRTYADWPMQTTVHEVLALLDQERAARAADRAAVLLEAADSYAKLTDQNEAYDREHGDLDEAARLQHGTVRDVVAGLRRMADEAQQRGAL